MEFELWLFAVKQLAQSYEMTQVIFSQLTENEKKDLRKEYEASIGGGDGKKKKENKTLKEYNDLINSFHNAVSIAERFVEKNDVRKLMKSHPVDPTNLDEEFLRRIFFAMENETIKVISYLNHVAQKVTAEGELKKGNDGIYYLDSTPVTEGMIVEFFYMNRWEIGRLCKGPGTFFGYFFLGFKNEVFDVELEGLKVRLRG